MSGHSKWANIRVKKTAQDAQRGKVFTKHAKLIEIAARAHGGDPDTNNALRNAVDNARAENVPNANIERAIKKGMGAVGGSQMEEVLYGCYGPENIACVIECFTDNRNRTIANLRGIIEKNGGKWADVGSVMFLFERKGVIVGNGNLTEALELQLIDLGAEDIAFGENVVTIKTNLIDLANVRSFLAKKGFEIVEAGLKFIPKQVVDIGDEGTAKRVMEFIEAVEEDDDVSDVFTNAFT